MRSKAGILLAVVVTVAAVGQAAAAEAQQAKKKKLTLERLYRYPKLEGTAPTRPKWSDDGHWLAFLWNDQGMPFRDLWVYDAENGQRRRLTQLPHEPDEWTRPKSHKDQRLKQYLPPPTGLPNYEWAPGVPLIAFTFRGELYLVKVEGGEVTRLTYTKGGESRPRFSPDSRRLGFVSGGELYVRNLATGVTVQLTTNGGLDIEDEGQRRPGNAPGTYKWSPDGQWIAFQQVDRSGEPERLIPNYSGHKVTTRKQRRTDAKDKNSKTRLGIVPPQGGKTVWLTAGSDDYYVDWEWSPDSSRIAVTRHEENQKNRHVDVMDVRAAIKDATKRKERSDEGAENAEKNAEKDAEKKKKKPEWIQTLYSERDDKWVCTLCNFVEWSPDGKQILFSSERDGWHHLYLLSADGSRAEPQQLTQGAWEVEVRGASAELTPKFSSDGLRVYFTANQEDLSRRDFYRVGLAGSQPERLTQREGFNAAIVSKNDSRVALLFSSFAQPWDLYVSEEANPAAGAAGLDREGKTWQGWKRVTTSPLPEFEEYEWPQPRIVEFPARDGKTLRALLFYPSVIPFDVIKEVRRNVPSKQRSRKKPRQPAPRVPIINFVHGAGYAQAVLNRWGGYATPRFQFNQFASQQGYLVIDVDYRGSSGYGRDWRTDVYLHLGGLDLQDELAAMDYLTTFGFADMKNAGVWGVSYGGFMTLMAMFHSPDTFKAGSAWASVTDWENYSRWYTQQRLRTPEEEPEAYQRSSPIHHVAGLKNHLQLQHGVVDSNVHFQDIIQLTDALVYAGKPFTQQFYPQSNHGWVRPEVWIHSTRSMFEFFEHHLKGKEPGR